MKLCTVQMLLELAWRKIFVSLLQFLPFPRPIFHKLSYPLRSMVHTWGLSVLCLPPNKVRKFFKLTEEEGRTWRDERLFADQNILTTRQTHIWYVKLFKKENPEGEIFMKCAHMLAQKYCKNRRFICDLCRKLHWQLLRSRNIQIHGHFLFYLFFKI